MSIRRRIVMASVLALLAGVPAGWLISTRAHLETLPLIAGFIVFFGATAGLVVVVQPLLQGSRHYKVLTSGVTVAAAAGGLLIGLLALPSNDVQRSQGRGAEPTGSTSSMASPQSTAAATSRATPTPASTPTYADSLPTKVLTEGRATIREGSSVQTKTALRIGVTHTYTSYVSVNLSTQLQECHGFPDVGQSLVLRDTAPGDYHYNRWHRVTVEEVDGAQARVTWQLGTGAAPDGQPCS